MTGSTIIGTFTRRDRCREANPTGVLPHGIGLRTGAGEWLLELPKADRRIVGVGLKELEFGWPIGMPLCRALASGLFELRVSLRSRRIARVIVCVHEEELFALHGFIKKTQKTPDGDLKLARSRKRQLERTK